MYYLITLEFEPINLPKNPGKIEQKFSGAAKFMKLLVCN